MNDLISRQDAINTLKEYEVVESDNFTKTDPITMMTIGTIANCVEAIVDLPSVEPNNEVHLCDFCKYDYPECPTKCSDVIFGNGIGHDNVCACAKFEIKQERTAKVKSKNYYGTTTNTVGYFTCIGKCGNCDCEVNEHYIYCPVCGARLEWK